MNSRTPSTIPNWTARQVVFATLEAVAIILVFWLLYSYREIILMLLIAIVFGTAIEPIVDWFVKRGLPRVEALVCTYALLLLTLGSFLVLVIPTMTNQSIKLFVEVPRLYNQFRAAMMASPSQIIQNIGSYLPLGIETFLRPTQSGEDTLSTVARLFNYSTAFVRVILAFISIFLLSSLWILEGERTIRSLLWLVPQRQRSITRYFIDAIQAKVGAYVLGQLILCLSIGILAFIAYIIIGLPNPLALALIAAVLEAVPVFGPTLGAIPAFLVAFSIEPTRALWVIIATTAMQTLENYLLVPRVMGASVGVNPMITLLSLASLTALLGLPGAILAIPMAAIIQLLLDQFLLANDSGEHWSSNGRDHTSLLRYEAQDLIRDVRKQLRIKEDPADEMSDQIEDSIEEIANELDLLLEELEGGEETV